MNGCHFIIMNILIAEDVPSNKFLFGRILRGDGHEVATVSNGFEAVDKLKGNSFDLIVVDLMMPKIDGIELIKFIKNNIHPKPIILVISALISDDAKLRAFQAGADEYITKPLAKDDLVNTVNFLLHGGKSENNLNFKPLKIKALPDFVGVAIAASTGGPPSLTKVFQNLKPNNRAAFFVVLHGPVWMLSSFTNRIASVNQMKVHLGETGIPIKPGEIYIAPGERHMVINHEKMEIEINDDPPENFIKPAADPLFRSVAKVFRSKSIGVVLTGMGSDGAIGAGHIAASNGIVIAENPNTAVLSSMPKSVVDLGLAREVVNLDKIADVIRDSIFLIMNRK